MTNQGIWEKPWGTFLGEGATKKEKDILVELNSPGQVGPKH
jgi:hypothetical protein